jgi:hypothetical protein
VGKIAQLEFPDEDPEVINAATREREKSGGEASRLQETSQMYRITGQPVTTSHGIEVYRWAGHRL